MRVTQSDIAKQVGVSQYAVSHALRGSKGQVSEATRQRILSVARKMGYRVSAAARSTRTRRTGNVGFLRSASTVLHSWYSQAMLDGVEMELEDHGLRCVLGRLHPRDIAAGRPLPPMLQEWTVDGLIINWIADVPQPLEDLLDELRLPAIWTNSRRDRDCVYPDDLGSGRRGTQILLERGHRRVVMVNYRNYGNRRPHHSFRDRCEGYSQVMREAGLEPRIVERAADYGESQWLALTRTWMASMSPDTSFVAIGDAEAMAILQAAGELGRVAGRSYSLICLDVGTSLRHLDVTRLAQPWEKIGREAVRIVRQRIEEPGASLPPCALPAELVEGSTLVDASGL